MHLTVKLVDWFPSKRMTLRRGVISALIDDVDVRTNTTPRLTMKTTKKLTKLNRVTMRLTCR